MLEILTIHPTTRLTLQTYLKRPPHALLLVGPEGTGKLAVAKAWAHDATQDHPDATLVITPDERGTITIEMVRQLYRSARSKRQQRQVIIIDHAHAMSIEAENAFLKLLEEPRDGVTFILTTAHAQALLPTVLSRVQHVRVRPLDNAALQRLAQQLQANITTAELAQLLFIAQGRVGTLVRLLTDQEVMAQTRQHMQLAKHLLTAQPYERYLAINQLGAQRDTCLAVLQAMQQMSVLQLQNSAARTQTQHWLHLSDVLDNTLQLLARNGNIKAQLLRLFASY